MFNGYLFPSCAPAVGALNFLRLITTFIERIVFMAEIIFPCPSCKQEIQCDESFRGKKIQCPICGNAIMVVVPSGDGGKRLAVATPGGDKNKPFVPMLQQGQIVHKKSGGARKGVTAAAVVLVLAALGFVVYTTGWYKQVT